MLNIVALQGRLTQTPELKTTPSGVSVCAFSIAVDRDYKGSDGEKQTDFVNCVAWRGTAEFLCKYFQKGQMLTLKGQVQTLRYVDKDGNNRTAFEILAESVNFCGGKETNSQPQNVFQQPNLSQSAPVPNMSFSHNATFEEFEAVSSDSDLPF